MSAVANAVGDFVSDTFEGIGNIAESTVREIGKGAESLGREIGKVGQAAINDPVGTIAKVAAIATQQYWALPLISAGTVVANGGDLGQAALAAGISYAGMYIASGISDYLASGAESSLMGVENLSDGSSLFSYSDGSTMLQTADGLTKFTAPTTITGSLNTAISNAVGNVATTALRGGDLNEILMSGVTGGAGTYVNLESTQGLKDLGLAAPIANVLGTTSGAVTKGVLSGQDASQVFNTALLNNIISTSLSQVGNEIKKTDIYKGLQKSVNETVNEFKDSFNTAKQKFFDEVSKNDQLKEQSKSEISSIFEKSDALKAEADSYKDNTLTPAQQIAQKAYETASTSYKEYESKSSEFSNLVSQYDKAKAAGDVELANSLADQANALIPSLNAATDKYNADFNLYDTANKDFDSKTKIYVAYNDKFKELDTQYSEINKKLEDQNNLTKQASNDLNTVYEKIQENTTNTAKQVESAYTKAEEYSPIAKNAFKDLYLGDGNLNRASNLSEQVNQLDSKQQKYFDFSTSFGLRPEDALKFSPDVSKMDVVARQAFYDELSKNPDLQNAFGVATEIDSLTDEQRLSYDYGRKYGFDYNTAIDASKVVGGLDKQEQDAYFNTLKNTGSSTLGGLFSLIKSFDEDDTQLVDPYAAALSQLKTPQAKEAYDYYVSVLGPTEALALAKGQDDAILAQGTGTQSAGTSGAYLPPGTVTVTNPPPGGTYAGPGVSKQEIEALEAKLESGQITEEEFNKQYQQLFQSTQTPENTPNDQIYYQDLIDKLFTSTDSKPKTLATTTTTPSTGSPTTTPPTTGGGGTKPDTGSGTGGTQPGTGVGGGTEPGSGGGGGTETGTGVGGGTGGTGTGGTGTGGTGSGGGFNLTPGATGTGGYGYGYNMLLTEDKYGGIKNLSPGLTQKMDYTLSGLPNKEEEQVNPMVQIPQFSTGGSSSAPTYDPFAADISGIKSSLSPGLTKAQLNYILTGLPGNLIGRAEGGSIQEHNPEFFSEGGLGSIKNRYVKGKGDGTSDSIPAMLANGEFVIPADVVSSLGNGSNDAGATILDEFLRTIRKHKRAADIKKLPPDSKGPLGYLLEAKRKVKA